MGWGHQLSGLTLTQALLLLCDASTVHSTKPRPGAGAAFCASWGWPFQSACVSCLGPPQVPPGQWPPTSLPAPTAVLSNAAALVS